MEDILYKNSATDIRIREMVEIIPDKDKELPNLIILTILSAGTGVGTPIFSKDASGTTVFSSIDEIGTKFILDGKEVTSDDFLVVTKSQYGTNYNFFGLLFEDSNEHILKISLVSSAIPSRFQKITTTGSGCSANSITHILISNSITLIDNNAFRDCNSLLSVTIPNSVTTIGNYAFSGCSGLTSITIPNSVTAISEGAFQGCSGLNQVTIPNSVTSIGNYAFNVCSNLTSVTIGNSVTDIGSSAFYGCSGLTSVTIGNSVTTIGDYAFQGCGGLTHVSIPNSVTDIGNHAFKGCSGLISITSLATTAPTITHITFYGINTDGTLHVPAGSDYSAWMATSDYYLGKYNWTKVEDA